MKKKELYKLDFETAIQKLMREKDDITDIEALKDFAVRNIYDENYFIAIHILESINNGGEYFDYDYCMGTLQEPQPLTSLEDLEVYCDD